MIATYQVDMRRSTVLSILLHLGVLLIVFVVNVWQPFSPKQFTFDQVEIIDSTTFDELVATTQAGSAGEDAADAPTQSQATQAEAEEAAPVEEAPTPPPASVEPSPEISTEPAVQPEALPEPIFNPQDQAEPQPLPQVDEATESGIADPDSLGREQASNTTTIDAPPPRDAAQLRQLAQEASEQATQTPQEEVVVTDAEDTQADVDTQAAAEVDATSQILPEAQEDAALSAAPAVAIAPPSRPADLAPPAPPAPEVETVEAEPAEVPSETETVIEETEAENTLEPEQDNTETETAGAIADVNDVGATDAPVDGSAEDAVIDDLLASVLEEQDGTQSSGRGLSRAEQAAATQKIHNNWVKSTIIEKDNYQNLVVTVGFKTDRTGNLVGEVQLIQPSQATTDYIVAFQAARRAVYESMPLDMPPDIDPEGVEWQLTFDPSPTAGGIF